MNYQDKFMDFVMTPPRQDQPKYDVYVPQVSTMRVLSDARTTGLGDAPLTGGSDNSQNWIMPVVIIVVSAMALMTLYAVLKR